ncbi:MAG: hypothetical protein F4037_05105, partial [Gemmatimonadales bacterium]|nr:hypothetical protein [Candidatus Palauibacter ramosifaciens]
MESNMAGKMLERLKAVHEHPAGRVALATIGTVISWFGVAPEAPVVAAGLTVFLWVHAAVMIRRRAGGRAAGVLATVVVLFALSAPDALKAQGFDQSAGDCGGAFDEETALWAGIAALTSGNLQAAGGAILVGAAATWDDFDPNCNAEVIVFGHVLGRLLGMPPGTSF